MPGHKSFLKAYYLETVRFLNRVKSKYAFCGQKNIEIDELHETHKAQLISRLLCIFPIFIETVGSNLDIYAAIPMLVEISFTDPNNNLMYTDKPMIQISSAILELPGEAICLKDENESTKVLIETLRRIGDESSAKIIGELARHRKPNKHESYDVNVATTKDGLSVTFRIIYRDFLQIKYRTNLISQLLKLDPELTENKFIAFLTKTGLKSIYNKAKKDEKNRIKNEFITEKIFNQFLIESGNLEIIPKAREKLKAMFIAQYMENRYNSGSTYFAKQEELTLRPDFKENDDACLKDFSQAVTSVFEQMQQFERTSLNLPERKKEIKFESITSGISGNVLHFLITGIRYYQIEYPEGNWTKDKCFLDGLKQLCFIHLVGDTAVKPAHHSYLEVEISFYFSLEIILLLEQAEEYATTIPMSQITGILHKAAKQAIDGMTILDYEQSRINSKPLNNNSETFFNTMQSKTKKQEPSTKAPTGSKN